MSPVEIITGNSAIAHGVRLARVQVIAPYPITPQTSIVDEIANFVANGQLEAKFINVESEHSSLAICLGAELAGARTFTATSSMGLGYMFEGLTFLHGMRLPVVIGVANRTLGAPMGGGGPDYSDVMAVRDFGFIQFYAESNQEALDTILMAYRIAEDHRVLLPAMVSVDGFYLSFSSEIVSIPEQEEVDAFLPAYQPTNALLDPDAPRALFCEPSATIHYDHQIEEVMQNVPQVINEVEEEFFRRFGRRYGMVEEYQCDGAEAIIVTVGSMTGTAREVVDRMREQGLPVGLLKLRVLRPFPTEEIRDIASRVKTLAIIDRNVSHGGGGGCGIICLDIKSALYGQQQNPSILNLIAGLGGLDITEQTISSFLLKALDASRKGMVEREVEWALPPLPTTRGIVPKDDYQRLVLPGTPSCAGCTANLLFRTTIETLGKDTCLIMPPSCISVVNTVGWPGYSPVKIPFYMTTFASTAATATGVRAGLDMRGKANNLVLGMAGDGGTADIGLQSLSGAAERKEPIIYLCYDNEAYMNTGIQRSGTTPFGARTTTTPVACLASGNPLSAKNMPKIMAAHDIPYIATASVAFLGDYKRKLRKAAQVVRDRRGLAYIHAHTPCSTGWRFPADQGIEVARLAVETNLWPLYEIEGGKLTLNKKIPKPKPVIEYAKLQGRFRHLDPQQIQDLQHYADQLISYIYSQLEEVSSKGDKHEVE
jgi:pyruvate ferredoxin oxidoreductase alpha subunit